MQLVEVALAADVVADAPLIHVPRLYQTASDPLSHLEGFDDGIGILLAAVQIVQFRRTRGLPELNHETCDVLGVEIVAHSIALVPPHFVLRHSMLQL